MQRTRPPSVVSRVATAALAAVLLAGCARAEPFESGPQSRAEPALRTGAGWRIDDATPEGRMVIEQHLQWLAAGRVPGSDTRWSAMTRTALLDLDQLLQANGAVPAGSAERWEYAWPRDSAFVAVALARTGHFADAERVMGFLARLHMVNGVGFQARYLLNGQGPPDGRPAQLDGVGWVLWALGEMYANRPDRPIPPALRTLADRCARIALSATVDGRLLPLPSPDYWEVPVPSITLGTVAPLLAGLRASAALYQRQGRTAEAGRSNVAAQHLQGQISETFAPSYQRLGHSGGLDAATAMLMPPFAPATREVTKAWHAYQSRAGRDSGGLAPGTAWRADGVSWTPEVALVAYTAASSGDRKTAEHWLDWLDQHRTSWGSLPEKVSASGLAAGPAPLAWTAALVVLAVDALEPPLLAGGELPAGPG